VWWQQLFDSLGLCGGFPEQISFFINPPFRGFWFPLSLSLFHLFSLTSLKTHDLVTDGSSKGKRRLQISGEK